MTKPSQDKVLFYLRRHLNDARARATVEHEALAKKQVPYAERQKLEAAAGTAQGEMEALEAAVACVMEHYRGE